MTGYGIYLIGAIATFLTLACMDLRTELKEPWIPSRSAGYYLSATILWFIFVLVCVYDWIRNRLRRRRR